MTDSTEAARRALVPIVNAAGPPLDEQTWDTDAVREEFEVVGFAAPFVVVIRKSDRVKGTLMFTHSPRVYYGFQEAS